MAKINRYNPCGKNEVEYAINGDYIKVSELREWVKENWFYLFKNEYLPSQRVVSIDTLLAAINTEGK